jgi:ribonuclease P protein component
VERKFRLTRSTDLQRVRRFGKSYAHPLLVLVAFPNPEPAVRCGVVAGRSLGNAVQRNRAKRLLRSLVQPYLPVLRNGWDLVLIARQPMLEASFPHLQVAFRTLLQRAKLLKEAPDV